MKSAKQAYIYPVEGVNKGDIPKWIERRLYRLGPGKYEVGSDKYNHLFDGLGMVQRYHISDGCVVFTSQYIHSDTYRKNMISNRIVMSEFGTVAFPDPCRSIFSRLFEWFDSGLADNTNICVYPIGDELFSATETSVIHRIDPQDLSTIGSVRLNKVLSIHRATAHQHINSDTGLVHLLGFINSPPSYALVTLPPIKKEESAELKNKYDMEDLLAEARIIGKVNAHWKLHPSYFHSFGMTENYYILLECPLAISVVDILKGNLFSKSFADVLKWWDQEKTLIHVINKETGEALPNIYMTDALFTFHHVNAHEEDGHLIVDYLGYDDGTIITNLYTETFEKPKKKCNVACRPRRLVVPLHIDLKTPDNENIVKLKGTTATAKKILSARNRATIYCTQEELSENISMELPTINYDMYNGKKYRYMYGIKDDKLYKIDVVNKMTVEWKSDDAKSIVNEAIFLSHPEAKSGKPEDEDFGVLLVPVISYDKSMERFQSLVIIDAKSMDEIGRSELKSVSIPFSFHGSFIKNSFE